MTEQHADAIEKIFTGKMNTCEFCGATEGVSWMHCDAWTNWLRLGCGCNVICCQKCKDQAEARRTELITANREKACKNEDDYLIDPSEDALKFIRARYFHAFDCSKDFRDWVAGVVGEEKMKEILKVPCQQCGAILGHTKYSFEDEDGNRSLKTMQQIEDYCYQKLGRDPESEPLTVGEPYTRDEYDIIMQTPTWDYYERKGWDHNLSITDDRDHWNEAFDATKGPSCGGDNEWSYGYFIYYMPERRYLGKWMKAGGDSPQVVQTNYQQLKEEAEQLAERFKSDSDESEYAYMNNPEWQEAHREIQSRKVYGYFCSKGCYEESKIKGCSIFA